MDPIHPWLDPIEVRRLAERLIRPVTGPSIHQLTDPGFGERFEGFAAATSPPPKPAPASVAAAPVVAEPSRHEPVAAPPVVPVPAVPPPEPSAPLPPAPAQEAATTARGPFLERIIRFRSWMVSQFGTRGLFILDRDGAVIFDDGSHGKLHFLARSLAKSVRRPGGDPGNVHVKVGAEVILEVIPLDSPYGWLVLGTVVPNALSPPAVAAIVTALGQVATPPGS